MASCVFVGFELFFSSFAFHVTIDHAYLSARGGGSALSSTLKPSNPGERGRVEQNLRRTRNTLTLSIPSEVSKFEI